MTDTLKKVYWDSCIWLGLINGEPGRVDNCEYLIEEATKGLVEIWTSSLTRAEVFKVKCPNDVKTLQEQKDRAFEEYLDQNFIVEVAVDRELGSLARVLMRKYSPPLNKPNDAIHLATALIHNLDEFNTYDREDLLRLDGKINKSNGDTMKICEVPNPPSFSKQLGLDNDVFNALTQDSDEKTAENKDQNG